MKPSRHVKLKVTEEEVNPKITFEAICCKCIPKESIDVYNE